MATLFIVATPIGNLQDITLRGVETLQSVHSVACEDTRHTGKLLASLKIKKPLISCHSNSGAGAAARVITILNDGNDVAYATDAGTPGISDPGVQLVQSAREEGHTVVPVPGPSAVAALASVAGIPGKSFFFDGFLSPKQGKRRKRLETLAAMEENFILYESPHRIVKLLEILAEIVPNRVLCIGREMTKLHEEIISGTPEELLDIFREKSAIKGEFTVFISGKKKG